MCPWPRGEIANGVDCRRAGCRGYRRVDAKSVHSRAVRQEGHRHTDDECKPDACDSSGTVTAPLRRGNDVDVSLRIRGLPHVVPKGLQVTHPNLRSLLRAALAPH
jgi:hypothetical protein